MLTCRDGPLLSSVGLALGCRSSLLVLTDILMVHVVIFLLFCAPSIWSWDKLGVSIVSVWAQDLLAEVLLVSV